MRRLVSVSLIATVLVAGSVAGQPVPFPKTTPPTFTIVSEFDLGQGRVRFTTSEQVPIQQKVQTKELIAGKEVIVERVVTRFATVLKQSEHKLADLEIVTGEGKKLKPDDVAATIKDRLVLVVLDESGLDPAYLKLLAKDALVFVRKKSEK